MTFSFCRDGDGRFDLDGSEIERRDGNSRGPLLNARV